MEEKKEDQIQTQTLPPPPYDLNAKWDACIDLTLRRFVYSSFAGALGGLLFFRSPVTRWASVAFGAGVGIGTAYTECSYILDGLTPKWTPAEVATVPPVAANQKSGILLLCLNCFSPSGTKNARQLLTVQLNGGTVSQMAECLARLDEVLVSFNVDSLITQDSTSRGSSSKSVQRKLEKKLRFHAKVKDNVASLSVKKEISKKRRLRSRQKKLKAYDLSALSEFLPELRSAPPKQKEEKQLKMNCKSRQKILIKESKRLEAVLNDPEFESDPLAAIQKHLQSTQPLPEISQQKSSSKTKKRKAKKKHSKLSGPDSMEM